LNGEKWRSPTNKPEYGSRSISTPAARSCNHAPRADSPFPRKYAPKSRRRTSRQTARGPATPSSRLSTAVPATARLLPAPAETTRQKGLSGGVRRRLVLDHLVALGVRRRHPGILNRLADLRILSHLVPAFRVVPEVDDHHAVVGTDDRRRNAAVLACFATRDFLDALHLPQDLVGVPGKLHDRYDHRLSHLRPPCSGRVEPTPSRC